MNPLSLDYHNLSFLCKWCGFQLILSNTHNYNFLDRILHFSLDCLTLVRIRVGLKITSFSLMLGMLCKAFPCLTSWLPQSLHFYEQLNGPVICFQSQRFSSLSSIKTLSESFESLYSYLACTSLDQSDFHLKGCQKVDFWNDRRLSHALQVLWLCQWCIGLFLRWNLRP